MINQSPSTSPNPVAASLEFVTMADVRHIVECRLRWYGLDEIAVEDIGQDSLGGIAVTIADRRQKETYCHRFETSVTVAPRGRESKQSLAA